VEPVLTGICALITLASIFIRVYMLFAPRSLWYDEALLAENIVTRTFASLVSAPLDNLQSAPVLYLYLVKIFGFIFNYAEGGLRLYSFFALLGVLILLYVLLSKVFKTGRALTAMGVAITATLSPYMYFSNEVKPYMGEVFFILAVLVLYHFYREKKVNITAMTVSFAIFLLFANSSLFFIAPVYIIEFFEKLIKKDRELWKIVLSGCVVLAFFLLYYSWWLMPVAKNELMIKHWENRFLRFPASMENIKHDINLVKYLLKEPRRLIWALELCLLGFVVSLLEKNRTTIVAGLAVLLIVTASMFKSMPMEERLNLYMYVLIVLYMIVCLANIRINGNKFLSKFVPVIIGCLLIAKNMNFVNFTHDFRIENEVNPLIEYAGEHIKDDEYLYSHIRSNFVVKYKTGYTGRIGNDGEGKENIIYGQNVFDWMGAAFDRTAVPGYPWDILWDFGRDGVYPNEIDRVIEAGKCYIIFSQTNTPDFEAMTSYGLDRLGRAGSLTRLMNVHDTYLYYFQADKRAEQ
jgi:hypothetical protein